jgi:hypothetical protein
MSGYLRNDDGGVEREAECWDHHTMGGVRTLQREGRGGAFSLA